jgi:hypothetical protein
MKGVVFSEFLEMVEDRFSPEIADRVIESSALASGGAYTSIGTYDHLELVKLVSNLAAVTGIPAPTLVHGFGKHLFSRFAILYPQLFERNDSAFALLERVEHTIHVEVLKLYPDAQLPKFECEAQGPDRLTIVYRSPRCFADLAAGLIEGCADHFGETIHVEREDLSDGAGAAVRFALTKSAAP